MTELRDVQRPRLRALIVTVVVILAMATCIMSSLVQLSRL
jgi:hypothetical protein